MNNNKKYITNDLSIAAYLLMRGKKLMSTGRDPRGTYIFEFDDHDDTAKSISLDFLSSECSIYDGYLRLLRGILKNP